MAGVLLGRLGKLRALAEALREHPDEVEYECIRMGVRLRDAPSPRLTWRDLWVILSCSPPESPIHMALSDTDTAPWRISDYLLAAVVDAVNIRLWQAGGGKGQKPRPVPRPEDTRHIGRDALPVDEMREWLGEGWLATEVVPVPLPEPDPRQTRDQAVRSAIADGRRRADVAAEHGISVSTVGRIVRS